MLLVGIVGIYGLRPHEVSQLIWQDAKKKGTKRIRDCGAEGFKKAIAGLEVMGLGERLQAGSVPAFRALKPWP